MRVKPTCTVNLSRIGLVVLAILSWAAPVQAQGLPLIRDSEIEALLTDYAKPIFRAAGFGSGRVTVRIVRNETFNASASTRRSTCAWTEHGE